jgi:predicted CxxxxCH...CXXCH cytochrome family protein
MRIQTSWLKMIFAPLALAALFACSNGNGSAAPALDSTGKHADTWVQQHMIAYKQANGGSGEVAFTTNCSQCHGSDLSGGISRVSCFSDSQNGISCHNNFDHSLGHPAAWSDPTGGGNFHSNASFNGALVRGSSTLASSTSCGRCHATDSDAILVGTIPSCLSAGSTLGIACHSTSPALHSSGCVSCHSVPPNNASAGAGAAPNRAGAHAKHLLLAGVSCDSCHLNYGSGSLKHARGAANGANGTAFLNPALSFKAKSGIFNYAGGKCSAVSCHGGVSTPAWYTGQINVASDCLLCHEQGTGTQSPQYNSFFSGSGQGKNLHQSHLDQARLNPVSGGRIVCTDCHDSGKLTATQHLGGLETPAFEGTAGTTLGGGTTQITSYGTIGNVNFSCANNCHLTVRWQ